MNKNTAILLAAVIAVVIPFRLPACTSLIFTKGSTTDGSVILTYSMDASFLYGELYFWPAKDYPQGSVLELYDWWDDGKYMGEIPQVEHTYQVMGNINEHQVAIAESTFMPVDPELYSQSRAIIDVGNLMYITLQRAASAREAITVMGNLVSLYGYSGFGESFSIIDKNEAWIMEMVGKGLRELGAVWVARKIPEGFISGHANQARITTFPLDDPENCLYSEDVIDFARENEYWSGNDSSFSFADVYAPPTNEMVRMGDNRIGNAFRRTGADVDEYKEYLRGNIKRSYPPLGAPGGIVKNRLPLWVEPGRKLSPDMIMDLMNDHYENTELDMSKGLWAGPYYLPYRTRPLKVLQGEEGYSHERPISIQQTGFSLLAQARGWMPDPLGGINWFGVDDTGHTVYSPVYCGSLTVPPCFSHREDGIINFTFDSAYWIFNLVSNLSYTRYSEIYPYVNRERDKLRRDFFSRVEATDELAMIAYEGSREEAIRIITETSLAAGETLMNKWTELWEFLFIKYLDGNIRPSTGLEFTKNKWGFPDYPGQKGYPTFWIESMLGRKLNLDLRTIYSQDELLEIFGKNNKNLTIYLILIITSAALATLSIVMFGLYIRERRRSGIGKNHNKA